MNKIDPDYFGVKSNEEMYFLLWVDELKDAGLVSRVEYEPESWLLFPGAKRAVRKKLKTKSKVVEMQLMQKHEYTCDFAVDWDVLAKDIFFSVLGRPGNKEAPIIAGCASGGIHRSFIETKGNFDMNNMTRLFSINQKWIYYQFYDYINLVKPLAKNGLFAKTFTPERFLLTDVAMKPRKISWEVRSLEQFINEQKK